MSIKAHIAFMFLKISSIVCFMLCHCYITKLQGRSSATCYQSLLHTQTILKTSEYKPIVVAASLDELCKIPFLVLTPSHTFVDHSRNWSRNKQLCFVEEKQTQFWPHIFHLYLLLGVCPLLPLNVFEQHRGRAEGILRNNTGSRSKRSWDCLILLK